MSTGGSKIREQVAQIFVDIHKQLFKEYCQSITDLSRAGLAEYVARRKAVIELLGQALEADENGKYSKEARIHSIICPMQVTSNDVPFDDMNLWLIDDRLAYHHYLASDKKFNTLPDLENDVDKRMDITVFDAALSYTADPDNINSITIVELKRPMRNDADNDPVAQVLRPLMAENLRKMAKSPQPIKKSHDHRLCRWFVGAPPGHFVVPPKGGVWLTAWCLSAS